MQQSADQHLAQFFTTISPVLVVAGGLFWTRSSHGLDAADIFVTLTLTSLISKPMRQLLIGYPSVASLIACFGRIQEFLSLDTAGDHRKYLSHAESHRSQGCKEDNPADTEKSGVASSPNDTDMSNSETQVVDALPAIRLDGVAIRPGSSDRAICKDMSLLIPASSLTVLTGPVGSGKTLLVKAIIGEIKANEGTIALKPNTTIAYCSQVPWLRNISIRDNIIAFSNFDPKWYQSVIDCCLLDEDLGALADGDQTLAGSGGAALSGGQKHRVVSDQLEL